MTVISFTYKDIKRVWSELYTINYKLVASDSWRDDVISPRLDKTYLVLQLFVFASEGHNFIFDDGELLLFFHATFTRRLSVLHQSKRTRKQCQ